MNKLTDSEASDLKDFTPYAPAIPGELHPFHENQQALIEALKLLPKNSPLDTLPTEVQTLLNAWIDGLDQARTEGTMKTIDILFAQAIFYETIDWQEALDATLDTAWVEAAVSYNATIEEQIKATIPSSLNRKAVSDLNETTQAIQNKVTKATQERTKNP